MKKIFLFFSVSIIIIITLYSCKSRTNQTLIDKQKVDYDSISVVLERIIDKDQNIRRVLIDSIGFDSPETSKYLKKMQVIDKKNQKIVSNILEKYGWLKKSMIGDKASEAIFYIIQHSNVKMMEKYLPQLKKMSMKGEADPIHAAMMEDRLLMRKGKKQIYGTQITTRLRKNKQKVVWPIKNPKKVDSLRKSVGFYNDIVEYAKEKEALYNPLEKLPDKN